MPRSEQPPGEIAADRAYRLDLFKRLTGMKETAWRTARRKGLKVRRSGAHCWVLGRDFLEYLEATDDQRNDT